MFATFKLLECISEAARDDVLSPTKTKTDTRFALAVALATTPSAIVLFHFVQEAQITSNILRSLIIA